MVRYKYFWVGLFVVLLLVVLSWGYDIHRGQLPTVDIWSRHLAENFANSRFYNMFLFITNFGSKAYLIPITIIMMILLYILYKEPITPAMLGFGTMLGSATNHFTKLILKRERPSLLEAADGVGYSFPSGHSMISIVFYGLLAYFIIKKVHSKTLRIFISTITVIIILLIGMSRYFINVHYITDIIAGYLLGWIFVFVWIKLYYYVVTGKTS